MVEFPAQMVDEGTVMVGFGFTVTTAVTVFVQPLAFVPVTT
jgi:hypothetical protein